jgi:hypothetical protein
MGVDFEIVAARPLPQSMTQRNAIVEDKTFAAPAAFGFRDILQIFQDSALEVINLGKAAREQVGAGFFAANAAGAEHRDLSMLGRVEMAGDEVLELSKPGRVGSTMLSPSVTISFFNRIFRRWNGIAVALEYFNSSLSSRPPNSTPCRNSSTSPEIASALPASVPLMPSWASSTLPLSLSSVQIVRSGSRSARKSGSAAN